MSIRIKKTFTRVNCKSMPGAIWLSDLQTFFALHSRLLGGHWFFFVYLEIITVEPKEISKYISCNFHCFFFFEIQKSYCHSFMIVFKCLAYFEGKLIKQGHLSKSARKHFKRLRVVTIWDLIMIVQRISLILGP